MSTSPRLPLKKGDLFWILLSLLVLLPSVYYPYVNAFDTPDFSLDPGDWRVVEAQPCADGSGGSGGAGAKCLQVGDEVLAIGKLDHAAFYRSLTVELLDGFARHGIARVRVLRRGRILSLPVHARSRAGVSWTALMGLL